MKFTKKKAAALTLTAVLACGTLAGCDLVTTNSLNDLRQVVAEVDISRNADFAAGGAYEDYADIIDTATVLKRDLLANYISVGYQYVESYGYTYEQAFDLILASLVNRQIYLQYALVYLFESGDYTVDGYYAAVDAAEEADKEIAGYAYFLDEETIAKTEYDLKVTFNTTLDSMETSIIEQEEEEHNHDTVRTTPTGVDTQNEDFYDTAYAIYTGKNSASYCGTYETVEGSTSATRKKAYKELLANLNAYGLIEKGENTSEITSLSYYQTERKGAYQDAIIDLLTERFEEEAEGTITSEWVRQRYEETLATQQNTFSEDTEAFETALDGVSDTSFVFFAPDENYGFVINILLPFSSTQTSQYNSSPADYGDPKGNKFLTRASLLQKVRATDQRTTWFTEHNDYSFVASEEDGAYTGGDANRQYLFFENNIKKSSATEGETAQYEPIANYYGKYTYNGKVEVTGENEHGETEYSFTPNKLSIDDFLGEMKDYLFFAGYTLEDEHAAGAEYYTRSVSEYYDEEGNVDYSKFLYYKGNIKELSSFNANEVFVAGSAENEVMSVINELSFAYNTDTAGLNTYLGYVVSPNETDYMKEFEYAAQLAVASGVGTVTVAPTDYGWHIMYCTFSYVGQQSPYVFDENEIAIEGSFSNLYFEALKASNLETYSTNRRTAIINSYDNDDCVTTYKERFSALIKQLDAE